MLRWALIFFLVAIGAAILGFTEIASGAAWAAKLLFFLFLACFVIAFVTGFSGWQRRRLIVVRYRNAHDPPRK